MMDLETRVKLRDFARTPEAKLLLHSIQEVYPEDAWRGVNSTDLLLKEQGRQDVVDCLRTILNTWATLSLNTGS